VTEDSYVAGQIEHALAADQRTHELGVRAEVAAEAAPGMIVRNEVSVTEVLPTEETTK
jgi:hypothetical protein